MIQGDPPIPDAARGGQKKKKAQQECLTMTKQQKKSEQDVYTKKLEGPFTMARRSSISKKGAEAYILQAPGQVPRWVAGQSQAKSDRYLENVAELMKKLQQQEFLTKKDAQSWLCSQA